MTASPRGRPEKIYRGSAARESTWGAVFEVAVIRGDALRITARTWLGRAAGRLPRRRARGAGRREAEARPRGPRRPAGSGMAHRHVGRRGTGPERPAATGSVRARAEPAA